jgi:hypothetical protein
MGSFRGLHENPATDTAVISVRGKQLKELHMRWGLSEGELVPPQVSLEQHCISLFYLMIDYSGNNDSEKRNVRERSGSAEVSVNHAKSLDYHRVINSTV